MQVITAALAFAITMLVLSMVTSTLVETIHRLLGMRERGLYYMLGRLHDQLLQPYRGGPVSDPAVMAEQRQAFQDRMSENRSPVAITAPTGTARTSYPPLVRPVGGPPAGAWRRLFAAAWPFIEWFGANWRGRGLANLTAAEFMERLGSHPLGDHIVRRAMTLRAATDVAGASPPTDPVDAVLQDIAQKFESYAKDASVFFERRARTLSVAVAIVLAFALHVDAIDIFKTFFSDPAAAEAVIKTFDPAKFDPEKRTSQPPAAPSGSELQKFQQAQKELEALNKQFTDAITDLKAAKSQLGGVIGWNEERKKAAAYFPARKQRVCEAPGKPSRDVGQAESCKSGETAGVRQAFGTFGVPRNWSVILGLLLGGLLIGLGGPFWYDMVKSLTSIREVAGGSRATSQQDTSAGGGALGIQPGAGGGAETSQPRTPVDIFKAARAGRLAVLPLPIR